MPVPRERETMTTTIATTIDKEEETELRCAVEVVLVEVVAETITEQTHAASMLDSMIGRSAGIKRISLTIDQIDTWVVVAEAAINKEETVEDLAEANPITLEEETSNKTITIKTRDKHSSHMIVIIMMFIEFQHPITHLVQLQFHHTVDSKRVRQCMEHWGAP